MRRSDTSWLLIACFFLALPLTAATRVEDPGAKMEQLLRSKKWDDAAKELATLEKKGRCTGASCLVAHALISTAQGKADQAADYSHQAAEVLDTEPALSAWLGNELGALLYRQARGSTTDLQLAEKAFRLAQSEYKGRLSNIRFNLATVLVALRQPEEAKRIMEALDSEGGLIVDREMAILGDFSAPSKD